MNGFYCEDCGEEFFNLKKIKSAGKEIFKSISQLIDILNKQTTTLILYDYDLLSFCCGNCRNYQIDNCDYWGHLISFRYYLLFVSSIFLPNENDVGLSWMAYTVWRSWMGCQLYYYLLFIVGFQTLNKRILGNYDSDYDPDNGSGSYDRDEDLDMMFPNGDDDDY